MMCWRLIIVKDISQITTAIEHGLVAAGIALAAIAVVDGMGTGRCAPTSSTSREN